MLYQKLKEYYFNSRLFDLTRVYSFSIKEKAKHQLIRTIGQKYALEIFIESGTYLGDMINAVKNDFVQIYSIELDSRLFQRAKKRFRQFSHISILEGNSSQILPKLLTKINSPCLFWLDAHYSEGITAKGSEITPILNEVQAILSWYHEGTVILIDDAKFLDNLVGLDSLQKLINQSKYQLNLRIENDIVEITPKKA